MLPSDTPLAWISSKPEDMDVSMVHRFLSQESTWAKGIPLELVEHSIANSLNFGIFLGNQQVGFARVVTDHATFAYLMDVFVLESHRGKGLSRLLLEAVTSHSSVRKARRVVLVSSNARGLYSKFGFAPLGKPETFMEITVANAYSGA